MTPPGACFFSVGSCSAGDCAYTPRPNTETCDDGDACTDGDVCNGNGACAGTLAPRCVDGGVDGGEAGVDGGTGGRAGADGSTEGGEAGIDGGTGGTAGTDGGVAGAGGAAGSGGRSDTGGSTSSTGARAGSAGTASGDVVAAKVEGGGCDCSLSRTNQSSEGALALLLGGLFLGRRRRGRASDSAA
jgi:MYXO-CTERM domain-containing protein